MKAIIQAIRTGHPDGAPELAAERELGEQLLASIDHARLPAHIAIIMDGNGRWAKQRGLPRVAGHRSGMRSVRVAIETCAQLGLKALTLYAFSVENWKRPRTEVEMLWRLLKAYLRSELPEIMRQDIRLNPIGRLDALPASVREGLEEAVAKTRNNRGLVVNLAINYGGRTELVDAVKQLVDEARRGDVVIDEAAISARLYTAGIPDPDLLIRTSGEMRVSNFLLWQIAYSELYVTDTFWPDFTRSELLRAVLEYQKRDRRFGGLTSAPESEGSDLAAPTAGDVSDSALEAALVAGVRTR
jgi:undecaprenyl diphosphate synthase